MKNNVWKRALQGLIVALSMSLLAAAAGARTQASLGDLSIPADRVPDWEHLDYLPPDTSGPEWETINLPCDSGSTLRDAARSGVEFKEYIIPANCKYVYGSTFQFNTSNVSIVGESRTTSIIEFTQQNSDMVLMQLQVFPTIWAFGDERSWTAGYTTGTKILTVGSTSGLVVGDWVRMKANTEPDWHDGARNLFASKLVCVGQTGGIGCSGLNANQIMLDRGLDTPMTQGGNVIEREVNDFVHHSGFSNLRIQHSNPSNVVKYRAMIHMRACHECWVTDNSFSDGGNRHIATNETVRSVIRGNDFGSNQCTNSDGSGCSWNKGTTYFAQGNSGVVFENNSISETPSGPLAEGGTGTVIAFNYMTSSNAVRCERHLFLHGKGVQATLMVGNDIDCMMQWDSHRDGQGYNNMMYRNRLRNDRTGNGGYIRGRMGGEDTGSYIHRFIAIIGNHVNELKGGPQLDSRAVDESVNSTHHMRDTWVSYNIARGDNNDGNPAILFETNGAVVRTTQHENYTQSEPHSSWAGKTFPVALYRTTAPSWWCEESGPFPNIGSFSDKAGEYSRLPAQIRLEGGTCTTPGGGGGEEVTPEPPIILSNN